MAVLKDTSLCAIVRDEKMNPAGGVERFLRCHLPYVEEAVVLDTGSIDGTREILDQMAKEFAHLKVYYGIFKGYARTRNMSLKKVKTKWALVLDADELLEPASFDAVEKDKKAFGESAVGFNFAIQDIASDDDFKSRKTRYSGLHNPRLFDARKGFKYELIYDRCEWLFDSNLGKPLRDMDNVHTIRNSAPIVHFRPAADGRAFKFSRWYSQINKLISEGVSPAQTEGFCKWKKLSPHRAKYSG